MDAFLSELKTLHEAQIKRLENNCGPAIAEEVHSKLVEAKLTSQQITVAVSKELARIAKLR